MAIAMVQEFEVGDDRSTANYDAVRAQLGVEADPPAGMILHTAGFTEGGTFRIFDVWETREAWERFRQKTTQAAGGEPARTRTPAERVRAAQAARKELDAIFAGLRETTTPP